MEANKKKSIKKEKKTKTTGIGVKISLFVSLLVLSCIIYFSIPGTTNYLVNWGIESVVGDVAPTTVHIKYTQDGKSWQGSGVIVGKDGIILTARHVVESAGEFTVTLADSRKFKTTKACVSKEFDVGYLKIAAENLPVAKWGDSDLMKLGSRLILVGSQFGDFHFNSVSLGFISSTDRSYAKEDPGMGWDVLFQTDAAANPGSSGGPAFNRKGELVAIVVGLYSPTGGFQGISYCVPSNVCKSIIDSVRIQFALQEIMIIEAKARLDALETRIDSMANALIELIYEVGKLEEECESN